MAVDQHEAFVRLEREIGLLLRRSRAISARLAGELHPDLDGAAYGLLALLQDAGPLRASDLVTRLGLDKSTVSRQIASLVELGLVDRTADPADGRAQVLTPSAEGSSRLASIRDERLAC
jgi:DNA-binding MarR family transcriptional regulator